MTDDTTGRIAGQTTAQHNPQYERIVLGAMLTSPLAITDVQDANLEPGDFYRPAHATLYAAILAAQQAGVPTEPAAVAGYLADTGALTAVGGVPALHEMVQAVPTAAHGKWYAQQLIELADRRRVLTELARVAQAATSGTDAEALATLADDVARAAVPRSAKHDGLTWLGDFADIGLRDIEMRKANPRGLPTGFTDLDRLLGGMRPGQLVVVAARPGQGKSTLALDVARHLAIRHRRTVVYFSLEMTTQELFDRCLSAQAAIAYTAVRAGDLTDADWTRASRALGPMAEAPLAFDDSTGQTLTQIANKLRKVQARHGLDLAIVDYLQLVGLGRRAESRQQEVAAVTRGLKELAGRLGVPILGLVQLNRTSEQRSDKVPQLSDMRDSGELEQAADVVIMIHREDYYDPESPRSGEADLLVRKNRGGPTDTITVAAQLYLARFVNMGPR